MLLERGMIPVASEADRAWAVAESDYPRRGLPAVKLRFLVHYAILAPSSHNAQPWIFDIHAEELRLLADRTRALPVCDPEDRELTLGCGAALFHLRIAIRHFGHAGEVETLSGLPPSVGGGLRPPGGSAAAPRPSARSGPRVLSGPSSRGLPDPADPDLLACVRLGGRHEPSLEESRLFEAILARRTNRQPFEAREVPRWLLAELEAAARAEGAWLEVVGAEARDAVADLVAEGDRIQFGDRAFRRELAAWIHSNRATSRDGMPGYALGLSDLASIVGPLVVRTFDVGDGRAARDRELATGSPVLAVLGTDADRPADWLAAGQALGRVLLRARADDVWASFLSQPVEVPELRPRLADAVGRPAGHPQLLLRMGYARGVPPTPRRPIADVLRWRPQPDEPRPPEATASPEA